MVTILPEPGEAPRIAQELLAVADDPSQVQVVSHPHFGFRVPEDVFDRFQATQGAQPQGDLQPEEPRKRRPGRPRKNPLPEAEVQEAVKSQATDPGQVQ